METKRVLKVLVVDDEEIVRRVVVKFVGILGHEAEEAVNGEEGLQAMEAAHYDLVIVDYRMPKMNGLEFLKQARGKFPATPIALITGHGGNDTLEEGRALGAILCIQKPFSLDHLRKLLEKIAGA